MSSNTTGITSVQINNKKDNEFALFGVCNFRWKKCFIAVCILLFTFHFLAIHYHFNRVQLRVGIRAYQFVVLNTPGNVTEQPIYDETSFDVKCNLTLQHTLHALNRTKTEQCKQEIETVGCILQNGLLLHPKKLPRQCPLNSKICIKFVSKSKDNCKVFFFKDASQKGDYLGCYRDDQSNRMFKVGVFDLHKDNSPENCIYHCLRVAQQVAGLQYQRECYCASELNLKNYEKLPEEKCNQYECPGDPNETCGGDLAMSLYKTGVGSFMRIPVEYANPNIVLKTKKPVKIAFLLQFNGRAVRQVKRLLKLIYRSEHFYYVHVDSRQNYMHKEMLKLENVIFDNFKVKRNRYSPIWGGASLLTMVLDSAKDLLEMQEFDYLINLSEADMPLMTVEELQAVLTKYSDANFITSNQPDGTYQFVRRQGVDKIFHECENRMWLLGDRQMPDGIRMDGGSDWFIAHRSFVEYAVHNQDPLVTGLKQMFKFAMLPLEAFLHTLAANSEFCTKTTGTNLRLINWQKKYGCKCQYLHIVDWCGCSPNVFKAFDIDRLRRPSIENKMQYFARKFEAVIDQSIIAAVEIDLKIASNIDYPNSIDDPVFTSYWENYYDPDDKHAASDKRLILFESLARSAIDRSPCFSKCSIKSTKSMNVYRVDDNFEGFTIAFDGQCLESVGNFSAELFAKFRKNSVIYKNSHHLAKNLKAVEVGTNFDLKEEIFRNFAGLITETSKPILLHKWIPEMVHHNAKGSINVTISWIDPAGNETHSQTAKLQSPTGIEHTEINVTNEDPLTVGIWTVNLSTDDKLLAYANFLILPDTKTDHDNRLIDSLVEKAYKIEDLCIQLEKDLHLEHDSPNTYTFLKLSQCQQKYNMQICKFTKWSSYFYDTKSEIRGVDTVRGILTPYS